MRFTSNGFPQNRLFAYEYDTSWVQQRPGDREPRRLHRRGEGADRGRAGRRPRPLSRHHGHARVPVHSGAGSARPPLRELRRPNRRYGAGRRADAGDLGRGRPDPRDRRSRERLLPGPRAHRGDDIGGGVRQVYEFLVGEAPETKQVVPEKPKQGQGRRPGARLPIQRRDRRRAARRLRGRTPRPGTRDSGKPIYKKPLDADGDFGPVKVNGRRHYEFAVTPGRPATTIHNYPEPFERDDYFYRVLDAPALRPFIEQARITSASRSPGCASAGATSGPERQRRAQVQRLRRDQSGDRAAAARGYSRCSTSTRTPTA